MNPRIEKMVLNILIGDKESPEILMGHSSDSDFNSMLRMVKTYRFNYHQGPEATSHLVANTDITFTSYPGSIASSDDFYLANGKHSRIIVSGITLKHQDAAQIMHGIDLEGTVFLSARVMAANRLAHNGKNWSLIMKRDPDLGAKQWLVIDEKRIKFLSQESSTISTTTEEVKSSNEIPTNTLQSADLVKAPANSNIVWLIDQTWRRLHAEDVSENFRKDGVEWLLDGTPFFQVIQDLNGLKSKDVRVNKKLQDSKDVIKFLQRNHGDLVSEPSTVDLKAYTSENHQLILQNGPFFTDSTHTHEEILEDDQENENSIAESFSPVYVQFLWD